MQTIAEEVAAEITNEEQHKLKKMIVAKQLYSSMLSQKIQKADNRTNLLIEGFQRIRTVTGLSDVNAIIERFVNRDETIKSLETAIAQGTMKLDALRANVESKTSKLTRMEQNALDVDGKRDVYKEIDEFDNMIMIGRSKVETLRKDVDKASAMIGDICQCTTRLLRRLRLTVAMPDENGGSAASSSNSHDIGSGRQRASTLLDGEDVTMTMLPAALERVEAGTKLLVKSAKEALRRQNALRVHVSSGGPAVVRHFDVSIRDAPTPHAAPTADSALGLKHMRASNVRVNMRLQSRGGARGGSAFVTIADAGLLPPLRGEADGVTRGDEAAAASPPSHVVADSDAKPSNDDASALDGVDNSGICDVDRTNGTHGTRVAQLHGDSQVRMAARAAKLQSMRIVKGVSEHKASPRARARRLLVANVTGDYVGDGSDYSGANSVSEDEPAWSAAPVKLGKKSLMPLRALLTEDVTEA